MPHILIVEDEVTFRTVAAAALTKHGHSAIEAEDGRTGLALLDFHPIDLIITDVLMPEQDGLELIMKIREGQNPCRSLPSPAIRRRPDSNQNSRKRSVRNACSASLSGWKICSPRFASCSRTRQPARKNYGCAFRGVSESPGKASAPPASPASRARNEFSRSCGSSQFPSP